MTMLKTNLKAQLLNYFNNNNKTPSEAAEDLATIIDTYIRTATVAVTGTGVGTITPVGIVATTTTSTGILT